jgi:hypothetical protein
MDLADSPPRPPPAAAPILSPSPPAKDERFDDGLSDTSLSQLEAEIEQGLSSDSPDSRSHGIAVNGTSTKDGSLSDDAMDVDSDDDDGDRAVPSHPKKRVSGREYFDPELYGLRRSVCSTLPHLCLDLVLRWSFVEVEADCARVVLGLNRIGLCFMYPILYQRTANSRMRPLPTRIATITVANGNPQNGQRPLLSVMV